MFKAPFIFLALIVLASMFRFPAIIGSNGTTHTAKDFSAVTLPLGEVVKQARLKTGMSEKDLAAAVGYGVTATNIEKIEKGLATPTRDVLKKMEQVLHASLLSVR